MLSSLFAYTFGYRAQCEHLRLRQTHGPGGALFMRVPPLLGGVCVCNEHEALFTMRLVNKQA